MKFKKRLIYYFFGFLLGLMITIFIIQQKDTEFNYLPNDRVLGDFKKKTRAGLEAKSYFGLILQELIAGPPWKLRGRPKVSG